jgi:diaminopropionate ammonia-lyase
MPKVRIKFNQNAKAPLKGADVSFVNKEIAERVRTFHRSFPAYAPTPLVKLDHLASHYGLKNIVVKDESYRFGLNAFKVLGGAYALGKILAEKMGKDISEVDSEYLRSEEVSDAVGDITFASTTDGNHGRGLAWAAEQFNKKAIIFMPKGSAPIRRDNIRAHGAECTITELNYDDCVRMAFQKAQENGWVTVQDTAWEGYTEIPNYIMQGYTTLAIEALEQMRDLDVLPTHIFLQAGVGCFAGAMLGFFMSVFGENCPRFVIVEPDAANCYYVSACAADGRPHNVDGDLLTLMAGLACGEPNLTSWEMLLDYPVAFASCADDVAATGMRVLGAPIKGDTPVTSGESGAATMGFLHWLMQTEEGREAKEKLGLDEDATVLCFSTEGDTSPELYKEIVWSCKNSL